MSKQNSFVLYKDSIDVVEKLTDEQAGQLIKAIFRYEVNGEVPELDLVTDIVFATMRQHLDRNKARFEATCKKRSEAGKKGNEVRWHGVANARKSDAEIANANNVSQKVANIADSESDSDNDNDIVIENDSDNVKAPSNIERINNMMKRLGYV